MLIAASSTTNHNAAFIDMITYERTLSHGHNRIDYSKVAGPLYAHKEGIFVLKATDDRIVSLQPLFWLPGFPMLYVKCTKTGKTKVQSGRRLTSENVFHKK